MSKHILPLTYSRGQRNLLVNRVWLTPSQLLWNSPDLLKLTATGGAVTTTETLKGKPTWHHNGKEGWPGIVSRFQLVILAGRRSKQLLNGAQPRIPVDPLKRRNTSIALEELRRGLVPFNGQHADAELDLSRV